MKNKTINTSNPLALREPAIPQAPTTEPPKGIVQPSNQYWSQATPPDPYLKLVQAYDLEAQTYKMYEVDPGPDGVVYSFAQEVHGPTYLYLTLEMNVKAASGVLITE